MPVGVPFFVSVKLAFTPNSLLKAIDIAIITNLSQWKIKTYNYLFYKGLTIIHYNFPLSVISVQSRSLDILYRVAFTALLFYAYFCVLN